jgi:hypothetical protein
MLCCRPRGGAGRDNLRPGRFQGRQNASASGRRLMVRFSDCSNSCKCVFARTPAMYGLKIPHEFWLLHEHGAAVTSNQLLRLQQFVQVCLCECTCTRRRRPFASGSGHGCADMNMISFEPFFDCSNSCRSLLFTWRAHHD